jgi:alpha-ketoglutarate-dependent dioxygenase FTO
VAVRIAHDEATPALRLPLRTRETYYMLADFNAHHHHAVLAGASERYSSTHRVAVTDRDTWRYIEVGLAM